MDIVERLRVDLDWPYGQTVMREAADEIERLRLHIEELQDKIKAEDCACSYDNPGDVCLAHSPTVERLRASEQAWKIIAKQNDRWSALPQSEKEAALQKALDDAIAEIERLRLALRIIAGKEQCIDNLMSNGDVAREALAPYQPRLTPK